MYKEEFEKIWSESGYIIVKGASVENGHDVLMSAEDGGVFRFRSSFAISQDDYSESAMNLISDGVNVHFSKLYGRDDFILSASDELPKRIPLEGENKIYMAVSKKDHDTPGRIVPGWIIPVTAGERRKDRNQQDMVSQLKDIMSPDEPRDVVLHDGHRDIVLPDEPGVIVLHDDIGDNISDRNCLYSEATVMYYLWKNTSGQDRIGLFQYRRFFASDASCMSQFDEYDMVTTIPSFIPVTTKTFFTRSMVIDMDWQLMMAAIEQDCSEYYEDALEYEKSHLYFPCNLFFMKRGLFDEMCSFVFKVTFDIEEFYKRYEIKRSERYLGYLVENLISIYICHSRNRIRKACVDMRFYPADING